VLLTSNPFLKEKRNAPSLSLAKKTQKSSNASLTQVDSIRGSLYFQGFN